jgi:hypothetical protein
MVRRRKLNFNDLRDLTPHPGSLSMNVEKWPTPTPHPNPLPSEGRGNPMGGNAGRLNQVHGFNARTSFRGNLSMNPERWLNARPHLGPLPQERMNHSPLAGKAGRIDPVQGLNARTLFRGNLSRGRRTGEGGQFYANGAHILTRGRNLPLTKPSNCPTVLGH